MPNYFEDNDDLRYYFEEALDWSALRAATHGDEGAVGHEQLREIVSRVGAVAAAQIAPAASAVDGDGLCLKDGEVCAPAALEAAAEALHGLGLCGLTLPRELGGQGAPPLVYFIHGELLARADASVMARYCHHAGIAMAALTLSLREGSTKVAKRTGHIVETRFRKVISELVAGEAWGSLDLTQANLDEDPSALRTTASRDAEGAWQVSGRVGSVPFGQGRWHFVLASTGTLGLPEGECPTGPSLFLVRAFDDTSEGRRRYVTVDSLDDAVGQRGIARVGLSFDAAPAELIGLPGEGAPLATLLMTHARMAVGFQCLGLAEAASRAARQHAAAHQRLGKPLDRHELIADQLDEMDADVVAIRALAMRAAFHQEMAEQLASVGARTEGGGDEESRRRALELEEHAAAARRLTPLLRYYATNRVVEITQRALELHGARGAHRGTRVEKLLRDAIVTPNDAGAIEREAVLVARDTIMRTLRAPQDFVRTLAHARWRQVSGRDALDKRVARLQYLSLNAQQTLLMRTAGDKVKGLKDKPVAEWPERFGRSWDTQHDFGYAMVHAERLTMLLVDQTVAELLLEQAHAHEARIPVLLRHLERAEPRARYLYDQIQTSGRRILSALGEDKSGSGVPPAQ